MSSVPPDRSPTTGRRHRDRQQIFVNRAIFTAIIVALVTVGAIIAGRIIGDDTDDLATGGASDSWNTVAVVTDEDVRVTDPATGEVLSTFDPGDDLLNSYVESYGSTLVLLALNGQLTQLDLADGATDTVRTTRDGTLVVTLGNRAVMSVGSASGGEVTVVDTRNRSTLAVGETAGLTVPRMFPGDLRVNTAGTHAAISDANSFQTGLVDLAGGSASFLAGQVADIAIESIVTVLRAGEQAELEVYKLDGESLGTVDVPSPSAVMLTGTTSMVTVAADGRITTVSSDGRTDDKDLITADGEPERIRRGFPALGNERLVVEADDAVYVLDEEGGIVAEAQGQLLTGVHTTSECIVVGDGTTTGRSQQVDLDSGDTLGTLYGGIVTAASFDGCTASVIGGPAPQLLVNGEATTVELVSGSLTGVAPDGGVAVASSFTSGESLVDVTDPTQVVTVSNESAIVRFVELP